MLQDPNVERYVSERLQPLQKQIKQLQAEVFRLMQAKNLHLQNVSNNEVVVCDNCNNGDDIPKGYQCAICGRTND